MNENDIKEEIIGTNFNFNNSINVKINHTKSLKFKPITPDTKNNRFEIGVICLNNKKLPNNDSLILNRSSKNIDEIISKNDRAYICYPGFDDEYYINTKKVEDKYDEFIFFIYRPQSDNKKSWIDHEIVKSVSNEICFISTIIENNANKTQINNIPFEYNKFGVTVLFNLVKDCDSWKLNVNHDNYQNGLDEIMEKFGFQIS